MAWRQETTALGLGTKVAAACMGLMIGLAPLTAQAKLPLKAAFDKPVSTVSWKLADIDATLPSDWSAYKFMVIEFKASSSQRFELALQTERGVISKRVHPYADVWTRAVIPLSFYREGPGDGFDLAATMNQPHKSYWMNIEAGGHGPTTGISAINVTMRYPAGSPTLEVRAFSLTNEDPGDDLLEKKPIVDAFGQYTVAEWPGKARTEADLKTAWAAESAALAAKAPNPDLTKYGGFARHKVRATGFFRVEKVDGRWWFVDPEGALFYSTGINGIGSGSGTRTAGREDYFAELPVTQGGQGGPPRPAGPAGQAGPPRNSASFTTANVVRRYGPDYQAAWAETTRQRLHAWGVNTAYGANLNNNDPKNPVAYVLTLRAFTGPSVMAMPDVYSDAFLADAEASAARSLDAHKDNPWLVGYYIGNEPPWPGRESQLVDLVLAGAPTKLAERFRAELAAKGDTPANRKAMVLAAFARYLEVVNGAMRRHAPNHLNLGIRFGGTPPIEVIRLARGFDVYSMNKYLWEPTDSIPAITAEFDLPILIGEFHIGAPGRGMAPGLVQAENQEERGAAYSYYVEHAAANPHVIGTHWFQWLDQPVTGRNDGENYNIGWVDVTDRPYEPLVKAAEKTHARLYDIRTGKTPPTTRRAKASQHGSPDSAVDLGEK